MSTDTLSRLISNELLETIERDFQVRDHKGRAITGSSRISRRTYRLSAPEERSGSSYIEPGVYYRVDNVQRRGGKAFGGGSAHTFKSLDEARIGADEYLINAERRVQRQFGEG